MTTAYNLTHRIYIQKPKENTTDENGNPVLDPWESITANPIWAARRGLMGRTFYAAAAVKAEDNILFTVHCNAVTKTIKTDMRIVEGITIADGVTTYDHIYTITAPIVDIADTHQWLEIHTKEVT